LASFDPLDSWSKYPGIIDSEKAARVGRLLRRGSDVKQMMAVVGEEGTAIDDFIVMLKAEFFDNVYLQQNAFDPVDAATSAERQQYVFDKILEFIDLEFEFDDKDTARRSLVRGQDLYRNWNYAAMDSEEFREIEAEIDAFLATKGKQEVAEEKFSPETANAK